MPGKSRLLTFAFRLLILSVLLSMLWLFAAQYYNVALVSLADIISPNETSLKALGSRILIDVPDLDAPISIHSFTLHYGLILMLALVLASVGIGIISRLKWLTAICFGALATHALGVAALSIGATWASGYAPSDEASRLVYSIFAVFWGLLPAVIGGAWCLFFWLPKFSSSHL